MSPTTDTIPGTADPRDPQPVEPGQPRTLAPHELSTVTLKRPGPVSLTHREGVFVHSFKCSICDLEFVVFSWQANRHTVGRTYCPECGQQTPMQHWRGQTSTHATFQGGGTEIYEMSPLIDGPLLDDSIYPAEERYDDSDDEPVSNALGALDV